MNQDMSFPPFGGSTTALTDRLRLRLLHLGGTSIDQRWGGHDYTSPHWRIYLNLDDGALGRCGPRETAFQRGHLYVVPAWLPWTGRCRGTVRHLNALLDLPNLPRERVARCCTRILHVGAPGQALADDWLALGLALAGGQTGTAQSARGYALCYAALTQAFVQLGAEADALPAAPSDQRLSEVLGWAERNLDQALSLAGIAAQARCSQAELSRRFHAALGTSPGRWLRERRLATAADLLRSTAENLGTIAQRCGYRDRSRFSKAFAAVMGCGPATWRRRQR